MSQSYMKRGHCEERSDEAISYYKNDEIAALPSVARNDNLLTRFLPLYGARNDNGNRKKMQIKKRTGYFFVKKENCLYSWTIHTEKVACPLKKVKK